MSFLNTGTKESESQTEIKETKLPDGWVTKIYRRKNEQYPFRITFTKDNHMIEEIRENSMLKYKWNYTNDVKDGPQYGWWGDSTKLKFKWNFKDGKRHGLQEEWSGSNDQLSSRQNYVDGLKDGLQQGWDEQGNLIYSKEFIKGMPREEYEDYARTLPSMVHSTLALEEPNLHEIIGEYLLSKD
jgi:antitoxin component YwqK of YwqJK toxin-antitoxin module